MRVVHVEQAFGVDHLALRERPPPALGPGQARVRMRAASLNYRDLMMVEGRYNPRQPLPLVPCSDGVGEVVEVGEGVTRVRPGQRVLPTFAQRWLAGDPTPEVYASTLGGPLDGALAEEMVVREEGLVEAPAHLSDEEAATLPCAALTAWSALVTHGDVKAGDTVVVLGTGGVSIFALQFAVLLGAEVVVTSSRDEKLARARGLGAKHFVNYKKEPSWSKAVRAATGGRGADLVVEVGGAGTFDESLRAVRPGGRVALIGVLSGGETSVNLTRVLMQGIRVQGVFVGHRQGFEAMNRAISAHQLRPVVDRVFDLADARAAFEAMRAGEHFGKIAVRVAPR
ncbi:MAG: NAD(P)-dependent alcohol dehydrogenase [Polyangiaceae bacterium]|jgi:NADPH:quinone reductase-like Zn-dependent oxidoreductase|nr:NAD(P)-dependent alcohol dehydrogenase [Polyangiaceae bacterium]